MSGASWEHEDSLTKILIICVKLSGVPPDPSPVDKLYPEAYTAIKPLKEEQVQLLKTILTPEACKVINTIYSLTPSAAAALQRITSSTGSDMPDDADPHAWSVAYENAVPHSSYRQRCAALRPCRDHTFSSTCSSLVIGVPIWTPMRRR